MFVPFGSIDPGSRIWIFQANRPLGGDELTVAHEKLRKFMDEWVVHGQPLKTSYKIAFDQFIILAADESEQMASGCSIDSSVRVLKELERQLGLALFDRNQVAFMEGDRVSMVPVGELKQKFQRGILNAGTFTFNNLVSTKGELEGGWIVPAGSTWLKRYIPNELEKV